MKMKENNIKQIWIEWMIVDETQFLPGFVEAYLIQEYYLKNKCLPIWNNSF